MHDGRILLLITDEQALAATSRGLLTASSFSSSFIRCWMWMDMLCMMCQVFVFHRHSSRYFAIIFVLIILYVNFTMCLKSNLQYYHHHHIPSLVDQQLFDNHLSLSPSAVSLQKRATNSNPNAIHSQQRKSQNDILCNRHTEHQCICEHNKGDLRNKFLSCDRFIEPKDLPVVSMQLRHVNLSARLHTNETYESYFKRRIAHMVSTYCEQQANECRGATLRLNKDNVIVLRVASPNATTNSTTLSFVVTKSSNVGSLNDLMIIDSTKIKYILSAQLAPLSRVLGGIRIDSIDVVHLSPNTNYNLNNADRDNPTDNSKLLILLAITALFLLITYIIATVKVCREYHERKRARKIEASLPATSNNLRDYGSCAAARATNVKQTNDNDQLRTSELSSRQEVFDIDESKRKRTNLIDERHFHLMFQCDPSQLPDEQLTFSNTSSPERTQPDQQQPSYGIQQSDQSQMPSEYHPTTSPLQQFTHQQQPSTSHSQKANNQETINRYHPITVVIASGSFDSTLANDQPEPALSHINQMDYDNRNDLEDIPERPISRRGSYSRDDVLDTMIKPAPALLSELVAIETHQVQRSRTAHKFGHWSSSESDEEMQPEGYHKLSEPDDELDRDEKDVKRAFNPSDIAKRSSSFGGSSDESESANDNRMHSEENFEERFEDDAEGEDGSVLAYKLLNESHISIAKLSESQSESEPQSQPSQNTSTSSAFIV